MDEIDADADEKRPCGTGREPGGLATRERILEAARAEFSRNGFSGARVERIARDARANIRMIYHYFGDKKSLYLVVLEEAYRGIRNVERLSAFQDDEPAAGMKRLIHFTFDFLSNDPHFVRLIMSENLMMGRFSRKSKVIPSMTEPLVRAIQTLLERGQEQQVFHPRVDSVHLYIAILSLCFVHVSNRYTLSTMFQTDIGDREWLSTTRVMVTDVLMTYLIAGDSQVAS